ncbi:MAG: hypothetical protein JW822_02390 [Spirochaetales bacterium]|nr:hypothetical protein [Spirochaetales bacterium]
MKKSLPFLGFISFFISVSLASLFSDAAILNIIQDPGGGTLVCKSKSTEIAMIKEKVVLKPLNYISYDGKDKPYRYKQGMVFEVSCSFTFKNTSGSSVSVLMGFPVEEFKWEFLSRDGSHDDYGSETDYISDFQAQADDRQLEVEWIKGSDYYGYYTFTVDFAPYQERTVINTYNHRMNRVFDMFGDLCVGYILETGSTWADVIQQCDIIIYRLEGVTYYSYKNIEPKSSDDIIKYFSSKEYYSPHIFASSSLKADAYGVYNPFCARDDRPETAWVEGAAGYGIGEWLALTPPSVENNSKKTGYHVIKGIKIHNGYQASQALYYKNSRVKKVRLCFFTEMPRNLSSYNKFNTYNEYKEYYNQVTAGISQELKRIKEGNASSNVYYIDVVLTDRMDAQQIVLSKPRACELCVIQILEVYEGSKYDDTCLAEIEFLW